MLGVLPVLTSATDTVAAITSKAIICIDFIIKKPLYLFFLFFITFLSAGTGSPRLTASLVSNDLCPVEL